MSLPKIVTALIATSMIAMGSACSVQEGQESQVSRREPWLWPDNADYILDADDHREAIERLTKSGITLVFSLKRQSSGNILEVYENGTLINSVVATIGRPDSTFSMTSPGLFSVDSYSRYHRSSRYDNAFMHWAIFFNGGIAVHASQDITDGGRRSHGCVRLRYTGRHQDAQWVWAKAHEHETSRIRFLIYR